jgi:hypothetical protein
MINPDGVAPKKRNALRARTTIVLEDDGVLADRNMTRTIAIFLPVLEIDIALKKRAAEAFDMMMTTKTIIIIIIVIEICVTVRKIDVDRIVTAVDTKRERDIIIKIDDVTRRIESTKGRPVDT